MQVQGTHGPRSRPSRDPRPAHAQVGPIDAGGPGPHADHGNLERIRTPLRALAAYEYQTVAPGGWMQGISQLQAAARVTAEAHNLSAAASGIAGMAREMEVRMYRHAWAAERPWEGLTAPSDNAWQAGAAALTHAPVAAPKTKPALPPGVAEIISVDESAAARSERPAVGADS